MLLVGSLLSVFKILISSGFLLSLQFITFNLLGLLLEDSLNEDSSVLVLVTLGCQVELVVESSVNFLCLSVFSQQSSEHSLSANPEDFCGPSTLSRSTSLTSTSVVASPDRFEMFSGSSARVNFLFTLHDETILDQFANKHTGVGLADLFHLIGVNPDSLLTAFQHLRSQSLLTL